MNETIKGTCGPMTQDPIEKSDFEVERFAAEMVESTATLANVLGSEAATFPNHLLRLLAKGRPVSPNEVADAANISRDKMKSILKMAPFEFDEHGNIVGGGLTLNETPHRIYVEGVDTPMYTWCAVDAIMFGPMLNKTVRIESTDPQTGEKISLIETAEKVEQVEPSSAVVSWRPFPKEGWEDIRGSACQYKNLFASRETASEWLSKHRPDAIILSPEEVHQIGRIVATTGLFKDSAQ